MKPSVVSVTPFTVMQFEASRMTIELPGEVDKSITRLSLLMAA